MNIDENLLPLNEQRVSRISDLEKTAVYNEDPKTSLYFTIYTLNQFIIGTMISAYTPISKSLEKAYGVSNGTVILSSSLFLVGNILSSLFVYPVCVKIGLTWTIRLAIILAFIGCFFRGLINWSFNFVLFG